MHRPILKIFIVIILFILSFLLFGYLAVRRTFPRIKGNLSLQSIQAEVTVRRDRWGVPHIQAQNERDLFAALGYVSAQDRLWQMDFSRRAARGQLAQIFGKALLPIDKLARTLDLPTIAGAILEQMPLDSRSLLQAYTSGVNEYIETHRKHLPLEFALLRYAPQPWDEADSIVLIRLFAWLLSVGWHADLTYGQIYSEIDANKFREILPFTDHYPKDKTFPKFIASKPLQGESGQTLFSSLFGTQGLGSNAWAVTGRFTKTHLPILANDTHLYFTAPNIFYIVHLMAPGLNAIGLNIPGTAGLVIGRNRHIAWGLTNGMVDDVDFFVEKLSDDSTHYIYKGRRFSVEVKEEIIPVRGGEPVKLVIRRTHNGPIVNNLLKTMMPLAEPTSLRWTGFDVSDEFTASLRVLHARNWKEFQQALRSFRNPGQNVVYADADGYIGYQLAAAVPRRKSGFGLLPLDAVSGGQDWVGYVPFERLPHSFNPKADFIASANNRLKTDYYISSYWEPAYRVRRIESLLNGLHGATVDSLARVQMDVFSPQAQRILPGLLKYLQSADLDTVQLQAMHFLQHWDFEEYPQSIAAMIFESFYQNLLRMTFIDELGKDLGADYLSLPHLNATALDRMIEQGRSAWFDDVTTPDRQEVLSDIVQKSFKATIDSLRTMKGDDPGQWRWGDVHTVTFTHPFGIRKRLARFFNIGPLALGGGNYTVNNSSFLPAEGFRAVFGPCMRQIVDFADPDGYYIVLSTGQSGQPFSRHYKDQMPLWAKGKLIRLSMNINELDRRHSHLLSLKPPYVH